MTTLAACTIVSKNYICFARVLAQSFHRHHPEGRFFVLLVDRNDGYIDANAEPFELLEAEDLDNIPRRDAFLFKYTLLECNTAIKPFFLEHLIDSHDLDNLVYFDPDILITGSLDCLASLVDQHSVVLTPHLTDPIDDDRYPGEQAILQSGSFNLGFVAFRVSEVSRRLLRWWQQRLYDKCLVRIPEGLFVDQKWMDLVPGLFKDVHILTDPGYNVAYWNLHGRSVAMTGAGPQVNDRPLIFFHFSGIQPGNLAGVSKHQDRFTLGEIGDAAQLYQQYSDLVIAAGYHDCNPWPYAFATFNNDVPIPDAARSLFHSLDAERQESFGNPFDHSPDGSFFNWLNQPVRGSAAPYLTRLLAHLHASRPDLSSGFPDPAAASFAAYSAWLLEVGRHQLRLDEAFLGSLDRPGVGDRLTPRGIKRRLVHAVKRLYHSPTGNRAKDTAKRWFGSERMKALKQRFRPTPPVIVVASPLDARKQLTLQRPGINLYGYLQAETGMGEAGRSLARALATTDIPHSLHNLDLGVVARQGDDSLANQLAAAPVYDINLFVANADQVLPIRQHLGPTVFADRYNVGLWLWELEDFPHQLYPAFEPLDEVWTPSSFCVDAISAASPVAVRRLPLPVAPGEGTQFDRGHFDLPREAFVFFFMFNFLSYFERKNPLATVRAFRSAFGDDPEKLLFLKSSQKDFANDSYELLVREIGDAPNIRLVDAYWSRDEVDAMSRLADCYVSLHRSEGFGLTLAEAMYHGTPVIAPPYSGNRDFFDLNNGYPVRFQLQDIDEPTGPYPAGSRWAAADEEHAAQQMRRVVEQVAERSALSIRAKEDIRRHLSTEQVGRLLQRRFDDIVRRQAS